jgi:hypothetical protein
MSWLRRPKIRGVKPMKSWKEKYTDYSAFVGKKVLEDVHLKDRERDGMKRLEDQC